MRNVENDFSRRPKLAKVGDGHQTSVFHQAIDELPREKEDSVVRKIESARVEAVIAEAHLIALRTVKSYKDVDFPLTVRSALGVLLKRELISEDTNSEARDMLDGRKAA
jgi:hypothetical protein